VTIKIMVTRVWVASALLVVLSCGRPHEARTAKEFVERYSSAWLREDVDVIVSMQYDLRRFDSSRIPPGKEAAVLKHNLENERKKVENEIARKGFAYRAGANLSYESERDHGDHIHVRVSVDVAKSDIVLIRDGGLLKIFPFPSWFN